MEKIETPQLQQLASQGKIFTNFHVASPISSSSRASFLTGLFPWRLGLDFFDGDVNSENENKDQQLPLIVNIANSLQSKGYYTAHIGKWHLGGLYLDEIAVRRSGNCSVAAGVNAYGFDETVVMSEGINHKQFQDQSTQNTYNTGGDYLFRNDQPLEKSPRSTSLTEKETDEAIRFVQERAKDPENKPFYLNLWYNAPNSPFFDESSFSTKDFPSDQTRKYASMISSLDANIGRLMAELDRDLSLSENTVVVFSSVTGSKRREGGALSEGEIKVPAIFRWKGKISPNTRCDSFVLSTDLFPTLLEMAQLPFPSNHRIDGISFLPLLLATEQQRSERKGDERLVVWHSVSPRVSAIRAFGWKLLWTDSTKSPSVWRVFDMYSEEEESRDLFPLFRSLCVESRNQQLLPNTSVLSLSQIAATPRKKDKESLLRSLLLIRHLQMVLSFFRAKGSQDYEDFYRPIALDIRFDSNKGFCRHRLGPLPFPFLSPEIMPAFCSSTSPREISFAHRCACRLNGPSSSSDHCSQFWFPESGSDLFWVPQPLFFGLTAAAPLKGSYLQHLKTILKWTDFQGICSRASLNSSESSLLMDQVQEEGDQALLVHHHDAISRSSSHSIELQQISSCDSSRSRATESGLWSPGDISQAYPSWQRSCVSRLFFDSVSERFVFQASLCGFDRPLFLQTLFSSPFPLAICPQSFQRLMHPSREKNFVDDNLFLFLQLLFLSTPYDETERVFGRENETSLESFDFSRLRFLRDLAVIDPLFLAALSDRCDLKESRVLAEETSSRWKDFFSFWSSTPSLDLVLLPWLQASDRCWNSLLLLQLQRLFSFSRSTETLFLPVIVYEGCSETSHCFRSDACLAALLRLVLSQILSQRGERGSVSVSFEIVRVSGDLTGSSLSLESLRQLLFLQRLLQSYRQSRVLPRELKLRLREMETAISQEEVQVIRWRLMQKIVFAAKRSFQELKRKLRISKDSGERRNRSSKRSRRRRGD